jgi:predicted GNAT superfamily acetyltransferase
VNKSPAAEKLVVRKCRSIDELHACVDLQREVWKFEDVDLVPLRMFVVAEKIGGQVIGCFDGDVLVGYALSVPGSRGQHAYLHSHMLAVRESYRDLGLGRRLKLAQRDDALQRGIALIEWTFDPLEIKNAYLNIVKLGVIAKKYSINHYGFSTSHLHRGLPTDRLIVEWWLKSKRVTGLLDQGRAPQISPVSKIHVPAEIYAWRASTVDLPKAVEVQERNRQEFIQAFSQGLTVIGYERDAARNGTYLLGTWDEEPDKDWRREMTAKETR